MEYCESWNNSKKFLIRKETLIESSFDVISDFNLLEWTTYLKAKIKYSMKKFEKIKNKDTSGLNLSLPVNFRTWFSHKNMRKWDLSYAGMTMIAFSFPFSETHFLTLVYRLLPANIYYYYPRWLSLPSNRTDLSEI